MVEELLESFVGIVDAELFKRVDFEDFESRNIQDSDEVLGSLLCQLGIDLIYNPKEQSVVESLGQGFSGVDGLLDVEMGLDVLGTGSDSGLADTQFESLWVDLQDFAGLSQGFFVVDSRSIGSEGIDFDVS